MSVPIESQDLIFNGTGVNYSWHFPRLFELDDATLRRFHSLTFISGASTAFLVYWAVRQGLASWKRDDFLDWNRHTHSVYGNNFFAGLIRSGRLALKRGLPIYSEEDYRRAWAMGVRPEFFELRMKDLPPNVRLPIYDTEAKQIVEPSLDPRFAETPAYLVSFAATAIPRIFPDIVLDGRKYGDITYSRQFLPWLKDFEKKSAYFENYNLLKDSEYPNGKYIKICEHPDPKKMMRNDNLKFLFGMRIDSYPSNVRRSRLGEN